MSLHNKHEFVYLSVSAISMFFCMQNSRSNVPVRHVVYQSMFGCDVTDIKSAGITLIYSYGNSTLPEESGHWFPQMVTCR